MADKNPNDDQAAELFAEVAQAYEVLSDKDKRILYDSGGMEAVEEAERAEKAPQDPFSASPNESNATHAGHPKRHCLIASATMSLGCFFGRLVLWWRW